MARKPKEISVYDKIIEIQEKISKEEEILKGLYTQLEELKAEKETLEMNQVWVLMKENGLTIEDVQAMIEKK